MANSRKKDTKTAVRVLSRALGYQDPHHCPQGAFLMPLTKLSHFIERHLISAGKGRHTVRNVKNNLSFLFRLATERKIIQPQSGPSKPRFKFQYRTPRRGSESSRNSGHYLSYEHWPNDLQCAFEEFRRWATDPIVEGRASSMRKREGTIQSYQLLMTAYFGYLRRIRGISTIYFDQLFELKLIQDFVRWHINERHKRVTMWIVRFLSFVTTLTSQYRDLPDLLATVKEMRQNLGKPPPVYDKNEVWVSLIEIEQVGISLWPQKRPEDIASNGANFAVHACMSLMLRLWCRRPYRQRNMREMSMQENLYREPDGRLVICFSGEQLKIAEKNGCRNTFLLPFPQDLIPVLEDYLRIWRPFLDRLSGGRYQNLFLNRLGEPYQLGTLSVAVERYIYSFTGKACNPHLIRSIFATTYIRKTGDYYGAAVMLNDALETTIKSYALIKTEGVAEKADLFLQEQFS